MKPLACISADMCTNDMCANISVTPTIIGSVLTLTTLVVALLSGVPPSLVAQGKLPAKILKHSGYAEIIRLNALNSPYLESNPSVSPDGKYLFFMSERGGQSWSQRKERINYEGFDGDIWYSEKSEGMWKPAEVLDGSVNSSRGEDEPNISFDGRTVVFQSWRDGWKMNDGPYYKAEFHGIAWGKPVGLGGGIHQFFYNARYKDSTYATDGATLAIDGKTFVFAAGPEYDGDMDLYMSRKVDDRWMYPKKISASTDWGNERSAFLAADSKTLYFASNAYEGIGGLDIYKGTLNADGTVDNIVNLGEPFNTKGDDYSFVLTATGEEAFFVRNGDLYYVSLGRKFDAIKPTPIAILHGVVKHKDSGVPLEAHITVRELPRGDTLSLSSHAVSGEYSCVLSIGKQYEQIITAPGCADVRRTFKVTPNKKGGCVRIEFDPLLAPPRKTW